MFLYHAHVYQNCKINLKIIISNTLKMAFFCDINAITMSSVCFPFSYIFLIFLIFPKSISMHTTILKISNIVFIIILKHTMSMWFIVGEIPKIFRLIWILNKSFSVFVIDAKHSFVNSIFGN